MERTILLAVAGLTPQVVTETLYHLVAVQERRIGEINIITTGVGEGIMRDYFLRADGPYYKFCADFGILPHEVTLKITVIRGKNGKKLEDIRTREDNEAMAQTIMKEVYAITEDPETTLIASIAGGRKTMSAYLALALQLFGREQDRLTHVLVWPPDLEAEQNFFYPRPGVKYYELSNGEKISAGNVRIDLAEIPVVRMRRIIEEEVGKGMTNYWELIELGQFKIDELKERIKAEWNVEKEDLRVRLGRKKYKVHLGGKLGAIFHYACEHAEGFEKSKYVAGELFEIYKKYYRKKDYTSSGQAEGWDVEHISKQISDINHRLIEGLPKPIANLLRIQSETSWDKTIYRMTFPVAKSSSSE